MGEIKTIEKFAIDQENLDIHIKKTQLFLYAFLNL